MNTMALHSTKTKIQVCSTDTDICPSCMSKIIEVMIEIQAINDSLTPPSTHTCCMLYCWTTYSRTLVSQWKCVSSQHACLVLLYMMAGTHELSQSVSACLTLYLKYSQYADFMNARNGHMYRATILGQFSVYGPLLPQLPHNAFQHMWPVLNALCLYGNSTKWYSRLSPRLEDLK